VQVRPFNWIGATVLVLAVFLLTAQTDPPQILPEPERERSFTIDGANLSIIPAAETIFLKFSGGVTCSSEEMSLSADVLELDVKTGMLTTQTRLKLPEMPESVDRSTTNPGEVVRSMAAQLELPEARFNARAIQRVGAAGGVSVEFQAFSLNTEELISIDGGNSWSASGRSVIRALDPNQKSEYELSADFLLFDARDQRALAQGNVSGKSLNNEVPEIELQAGRVMLDATSRVLTADNWLRIRYGNYEISCGSPDQEKAQKVETELPEMTDATVSFSFDTQQVEARGGVLFEDLSDGTRISAEELSADLSRPWLEIRGDPLLTRGSNSFSGTKFVVWREDGQTIVEIEGPQSATFNLDELEPIDGGEPETSPQ